VTTKTMHLPNWIPKGYWVVLFIRLKIQPNSIRFIADISLGIWDYLCSSPHNWYTTALFRLAWWWPIWPLDQIRYITCSFINRGDALSY